MTAVAELRAAADKIRARAEVATPGPWKADHREYPESIRGGELGSVGVIAGSRWCGEANVFDNNDDAYHIALWHPGIALVIADWLDAEAMGVEAASAGWPEVNPEKWALWTLRIARAINATEVA